MAPRERAGKAVDLSGGSRDDDDTADAAFMLLPEKEKRKIMKALRAKEMAAKPRPPSVRKAATPIRFNQDQPLPRPPATPAAAAAAVEDVDKEDDETPEALPKTPTIAARNQSQPRDRSAGSDRRGREAAQQKAAAEASRKRPRQPDLAPLPEAVDGEEGGEEEADSEEEREDELDDDEPEPLDPEATGRPVRSEAERGKVSYKNNSAPRPTGTTRRTLPLQTPTPTHPLCRR